jgi:hypothetical protein
MQQQPPMAQQFRMQEPHEYGVGGLNIPPQAQHPARLDPGYDGEGTLLSYGGSDIDRAYSNSGAESSSEGMLSDDANHGTHDSEHGSEYDYSSGNGSLRSATSQHPEGGAYEAKVRWLAGGGCG